MTTTAALAGRNLLRMRRNPAVVTSTFVVPAVFLLGFATVLSAALRRRGIDAGQYLPPAVVVQSAFFVAMGSALWTADDVATGMLDRFRSLPVARTAVAAGRTFADLARVLVSLAVVLAVGAALGFSFRAGVVPALGFVALTLACGATLALAFNVVALRARNPETATDLLSLVYLPLLMLSTAFVPTAAFPSWLEGVAAHQPVSAVIDALRALSTGGTTAGPVTTAVLWLAALTAAALALTVRR